MITEIEKKFAKLYSQKLKEEKRLTKHNVFSILRMEDFEIRHSNFLAWLFDKSSNEEIAHNFLKMFLKELKSRPDFFVNINLNQISASNYVVKREVKYKDILIESEDCKKVIVIENKIYSTEHSNQLNRYYNEVMQDEKYADYDKYFVYLTLGGDMPIMEEDRNKWIPFSYIQIIKILQKIEKNKSKKISAEISLLISNYIEILEDKVEKNMCRIKEYRKLYDKYPDIALEFRDYIPDLEERLRIQRDYIKDSKDCSLGTENDKTYVVFTNKELEQLSKEKFQKEQAVTFEFNNNARFSISLRLNIKNYDVIKRKVFIEKLEDKFNLGKSSHNINAPLNTVTIHKIINIKDDDPRKEFEIQDQIYNNLKLLFEDTNSIYYQVVDFIKKEYFGV